MLTCNITKNIYLQNRYDFFQILFIFGTVFTAFSCMGLKKCVNHYKTLKRVKKCMLTIKHSKE